MRVDFTSNPVLRCGGRVLALGTRTFVMGVVNVTPDSFSDGGEHLAPVAAYDHAMRLLDDGADVLDLGAESTRPAAQAVPADVELARLTPVVERLVNAGITNLSIDTMKPAVASAALDLGAAWINDVSGLADAQLASASARADALVVMHARPMRAGHSSDDVVYGDVVSEVAEELRSLRERSAAQGFAGMVVVDPGIGFGKTVQNNLDLLDRVGEIRAMGAPVLVGPSRKRFLAALAELKDERDTRAARDSATVGACCLAAMRGVDIVRVHDVAATRAALAIVDALR